MRKLKNDLTGRTFNDLYVIGVADDGQRKIHYICQCKCGNIKKVRADRLTSGTVKSCGCRKKRTDRENVQNVPAMRKQKERGFRCGNLRIYQTWQGMKRRCYNRQDARYNIYGGRGIAMCEEWKKDFEDDEKGLLPKELKRGVLSEDGIYNLRDAGKAVP